MLVKGATDGKNLPAVTAVQCQFALNRQSYLVFRPTNHKSQPIWRGVGVGGGWWGGGGGWWGVGGGWWGWVVGAWPPIGWLLWDMIGLPRVAMHCGITWPMENSAVSMRAWRTCRDAWWDRILRLPLKSASGKTFPAFPAHAQPAILRIW